MSTDQLGDGAALDPQSPVPDRLTLDPDFVIAAAVMEPSARERERAAKAARRAARRRALTARLPRVPRLPGVPERFRPPPRTLVALLVVAALATGVVWTARRNPSPPAGADGTAAADLAGLVREMRAAGESDARAVSPFAGSPAAALADGVAGLEAAGAAASATAVTGFAPEEVAVAVAHTRRLLVASHLEPKVLLGGDPQPVLRLLAPRSAARLEAALARPTTQLTASSFLTRFPDGTRLVGPVIKVAAQMSVASVRAGALRVAADATFVYPVAPASGGPTTLLVVRHDGAWEYDRAAGGLGKAEVVGGAGMWSSGQCLENDRGFVWPPFVTADGYERRSTAPVHDPWDFDAPLPDSTGCAA